MEDTQQYQDALKEATHKGVNTGTLYRKNDQSLRCDFFGVSSLQWRKSGVDNDTLNDEKYYEVL